MNYNISYSQVIKENKIDKVYTRKIELLIMANVNFKNPGEQIIKYVLEKEYKANIHIKSIYDYDMSDIDKEKRYDYGICFHYQDRLNANSENNESYIFLKKIYDSFVNINHLIFINDTKYSIASDLKAYQVPLTYYELRSGKDRRVNFEWYDLRNYLLHDFPYSMLGCFNIAYLLLRLIRNIEGNYKKCVVLDCDNVLWGGVIEEKGMEKIQLDTVYPGNIYYRFQKYICNLIAKGVLVALCSKNEEKNVLDIINLHPFMLLRENKVVSYRINWNNKVKNILELSAELNIDLSDFVFIDDSPEEVNLVQRYLPQVDSILFDDFFKYHYEEYFDVRGTFRDNDITQEDSRRTQMYMEEKRRKKLKETVVDEKLFLASLNLKLIKENIDSFNVSRIVQLSKRTHKANLSSRKYTVESLDIVKKNYDIFCFKLTDKFGDYGYIGAIIFNIRKDTLYVKDFYLSCRALGKGIEKMIIDSILVDRPYKIKNIVYDFKETPQNKSFQLNFVKILKEAMFVEINHLCL